VNEAALVVGAIRVLSALPVLRWPLAGGLFAIGMDLADLALFTYLGFGWPPDYQQFDKVADMAYLLAFLAVALRWRRPEREVAVGLFAVRMVGVLAFTWSGQRAALLLAPNLFEAWFLLVAARDRFRPGLAFTPRRLALALLALLALKLPQEYLLHVDRRLDHYALADVVDQLLRRAGRR